MHVLKFGCGLLLLIVIAFRYKTYLDLNNHVGFVGNLYVSQTVAELKRWFTILWFFFFFL